MAITYSISPPAIQGPVIACTVFGALATLTTGLRLYAMHLKGIQAGISEYTLLIGLLLMFGVLSTIWIMTIYGGMGRHVEDVAPSAVVITMKTLLSIEVLYGICLGLVKTSIALFFVRIFGAKRSFNISVVIVLITVWVWTISIILEAFLLCRPFAYNWDKSINGSCGNRNAAFIVAGVMNVITDFMVMALPLPHVWTLKMNWQKKLGLTSVFCVGAVISAISIIRMVSLAKLDFEDPTKSLLLVILWSVIEPELAIICANMPFLKTIVAAWAPGLGSSIDRKYGVSSTKTFEHLGTNGESSHRMDNLEASHTYKVGHDGNSSKEATMYADSIDSDEQRLASNPSPYGISVTKNFDVRYD